MACNGAWSGTMDVTVQDVRSQIEALLAEHSGRTKPLVDEPDLFDAYGLDGDDAFEFIEDFATRFGVDMSDYRWYFHHGEEGWNIGALFFAPPSRRVTRIPITLNTLISAIETRRWPIDYPAHRLPQVRWDVWLTWMILVPIVVLVVGLWLWKVFGR